MTFGERLRQLREGKYSQEELAGELNVNNNTISKWENDTQEPRAKRVAELARILGTTPAYLLGDTDNPRKEDNNKLENKSQIVETGHSLVYERNGERMELPPTEQSYAIFRELALKMATREISQPVMGGKSVALAG